MAASTAIPQLHEADKGAGPLFSADLKNFPRVSFALVADPELKLFKQYGAFNGKPQHTTREEKGSGVNDGDILYLLREDGCSNV